MAVLAAIHAEENKAVVRRFFDQCLDGARGATDSRSVSGDMEQHITALRVAFADLCVGVADLFADGDLVAGRFTWEGTHTGTFVTRLGIFPATGRRVTSTVSAVYRVTKGRIEAVQASRDLLTISLLQCLDRYPGGTRDRSA